MARIQCAVEVGIRMGGRREEGVILPRPVRIGNPSSASFWGGGSGMNSERYSAAKAAQGPCVTGDERTVQ